MGKFLDIIKDAYKRMGEVDVPDSEGADYTTFINNVDEKKILADAMAETKRMEDNIGVKDTGKRKSSKSKNSREDKNNRPVRNVQKNKTRTTAKQKEHEERE